MRKFLALAPAERRFFLAALFLFWAARLGVWLLPFAAVRRLFARLEGRRDAPRLPLDRAAYLLDVAGRFLPGSRNCLPQALAARLLLSQQGYTPDLRIGVTRDEHGRLDAHAWVECEGVPVVGGGELDRFTRLPGLEGRG